LSTVPGVRCFNVHLMLSQMRNSPVSVLVNLSGLCKTCGVVGLDVLTIKNDTSVVLCTQADCMCSLDFRV
jgi:hypothetical protein